MTRCSIKSAAGTGSVAYRSARSGVGVRGRRDDRRDASSRTHGRRAACGARVSIALDLRGSVRQTIGMPCDPSSSALVVEPQRERSGPSVAKASRRANVDRSRVEAGSRDVVPIDAVDAQSALRLLARVIAHEIVAELRSGDVPDMVDSTQSCLGRKRHCAFARLLIARGDPRAAQIGRRYLLTAEAVDEAMQHYTEKARRAQHIAANDGAEEQLAADLGLASYSRGKTMARRKS